LTVKEHIFHPSQKKSQRKLYGEEKNLAGKLSGFRIATEGIVFAGNPIGNIEFVNFEVGKTVAKHAKRLAAIKDFANTSSIDVRASPFKGFYKHLALALIQHTCDRRLAAIREFGNTSSIDVRASPFKGFYKHLALALIQHTCDRRLDHAVPRSIPVAIREFGNTSSIDVRASPFKGFYKHLALALIQHTCDRRRFAASVAVRHLNNIGVYLSAKREEYGRLGCARKRNKENRRLDVCAPACGVLGDGFSKFSRNADGTPLLAIQQSEETRRARAVIDVMSTDGTLTNLGDDQVVEGLVGGVPFVA